MTTYIQSLHRSMETAALIAPLVRRGLGNEYRQIIDLCSGAGGPMIDVVHMLRSEPGSFGASLVLTDLYPHHQAAKSINSSGNDWLRYETEPIDAANVPSKLIGLRTMICSLHHMPPEVAKRIVKDAVEKQQPFLAFEISDNSSPGWLWWLAIPIGFLLTLVMTLWMRPLSLKQIVFTYFIPILPVVIAWDGAVSNARTYTKSDLGELLGELETANYVWEINTLRSSKLPTPMLYLLGLPKSV